MSIRGESVLEKLERLTGAPRAMFLQKWVRWIQGLIPPKTDPAVIIGEPTITEDTVIKIFKEYCPDLEESECYNKLVEVFLHSKATGKKLFERDFIADFEVKSKISEAVTKALKLDFEVNPAVADQLYKTIFEERNAEKACELIKEDVKKRWLLLDVEPPAEELKLAEETCSKIRELVARRAPVTEWWEVLEPVYRTREEIDPSIKPYIAKLKKWGVDKDMEFLVRRARPENIIILAGDGAIRRETGLRIIFMEDMKPYDLVDKQVLEERLKGRVTIYSAIQAKQANEFWYTNKFKKDGMEIPLMCVYDKGSDFIVACDRPAILVKYAEPILVAPIPTAKMVKELYRLGILVEAKP
jgi:hypothetical protein